ncbi:asparagine synthase-related protein [Yeosuana sp. MJ-SS3]|uniref:asparagine synthase (glutamine-hydrolyzing) n=1 Tax=Gilvirhabdus luticola TaxID=3079858 RepID=A0ABU3U4X6_9FLAO|nr:asparagine synthase-related protein [Yeosuana sp. MJ-SS3]MDU8885466.1 asparagine synthase-related protein [Yeosuana sp. MJ-SS3]
MIKLTTPIIPSKQVFAKVNAPHELHLEAICVFAAIGFFLDQDTYWKDDIVLRAATDHVLDTSNILLKSKPWFHWHYSPRDISFSQALEEFSELFETIILEQTQNKKVILPLSGGLDSRTQAVALKQIKADVYSYSYEFEHGYQETKIAKQIAQTCGFKYDSYSIQKGYLWQVLDELYQINKGYSDFTSPRQMAIYNKMNSMGDMFSLGHWGDVLFDDMKVGENISLDEQVNILIKKLLKKGGLDFGKHLWRSWELKGDFYDYFYNRIYSLMKRIDIPHSPNARIRAFKSMYWAPRWTSINLAIFESKHPISLPYYDNRMSQFICTIPEAYLKNRLLQIGYIKRRSPEIAKIEWQDHHPFNLNNYQFNKSPFNLPFRISNRLQQTLKLLLGMPYIQRNWELQFLGRDNENQLKNALEQSHLDQWISKQLINKYTEQFFRIDSINNAHAMNMLLVLAKFNQASRYV